MKVTNIRLFLAITSLLPIIMTSKCPDDFPGIEHGFGDTEKRIAENIFKFSWDVTVKLLTRKTMHSAVQLVLPTTRYSALQNMNWKNKFVIIIHGFMSSSDESWVKLLAKAYLKQRNVNMCIVDWSGGALTINYFKAIENAKMTSQKLVGFIQGLKKEFHLNAGDIHIIGHSLGAHMGGWIGKEIQGTRRITGLDPAGPLAYRDFSPLSTQNAKYVDIIHTTSGLGLNKSLGHIDIYANTINKQPGCTDKDIIWDSMCSHSKAVTYLLESIDDLSCDFIASKNLARAQRTIRPGEFDDKQDTKLGFDTFQTSARGDFYLITNKCYPFCKGAKSVHEKRRS